MSRLESFIRRMIAQRDALNQVHREVLRMSGPVVEMGLGGGRTYDHMAKQYGAKRIVVFDRDPWPNEMEAASPKHFIQGEIKTTHKAFADLNAALVHIDIGSRSKLTDIETLEWLASAATTVSASNGFILSGLPLEHSQLVEQPLKDVPAGRYFLYRKR